MSTLTDAVTPGLGRRAVRNTALVLVARVISRLIGLAGVIVIGRHLGDSGFGELQTLVTYTAVVGAVTDLGCNTLLVRESARRLDLLERYLDNVLSVRVLLSAVGLGLLAALLVIPGLEYLLLPGFALATTGAYSNLLRGAFYATQRLGYEAADIVLESAVLLGLALLGASRGAGVSFYVWAYAASYAAACVFFVVCLRSTGIARVRWRLDRDLLRPWLSAGLPLAITYVMTNLYFKVDVPILQRNRPYSEVGWYTLAYRPFEALLFLPVTIRSVVFPIMSVYFASSAAHLRLAVEKLFKVLLFVGLPISIALAVLAPGVTSLLHLFPESEPALRILALAVVVVFVNNTAVAALNAMDRQTTFAVLALCDLVINVALNLALIPRYGYLAAASTTVATEAVSAVIGWFLLARYGQRIAVWRVAPRILVAGAVTVGVLLPFRDVHGFAVLGPLALGGAVYLAAALVLRVADEEDRRLLRGAARLPAA